MGSLWSKYLFENIMRRCKFIACVRKVKWADKESGRKRLQFRFENIHSDVIFLPYYIFGKKIFVRFQKRIN